MLLNKGHLSSQEGYAVFGGHAFGDARDLGRQHPHGDPATWGLGDSVAPKRKS